MTEKQQAAEEIKALSQKITHLNLRYYRDDISEVSDREFDRLLAHLQELEEKFPDLAAPDSPTKRVGGTVTKDFPTVAHRFPMLSLSNTYNREDLTDFDERIQKTLEDEPYEYVCELKFDGVAISLIYENGLLSRAVTRGDGKKGDVVTDNVRTIRNIPLRIDTDLELLEVRGEIMLSKTNFEVLVAEANEENRRREDEGKKPQPVPANPRNTASGTVKMQDSAVVAKRKLDCYVYDIQSDSLPFATHSEGLAFLKEAGFSVSEKTQICKTLEEISDYLTENETGRHALPFETDGAVIKINNFRLRELLGNTAKSPRWAVAYKFASENATTVLKNISYQVGRTGAVTPVAELKPVKLAGTTVKRASLHNANEIARLDVRLGDTVFVEKGGEIIPKITGVNLDARPAGSETVRFIENCPECAAVLVREEGEAAFYCPNAGGCPPQISGRIAHFTSKKAADIGKIGEKTINLLCAKGLVRSPADLYDLTKEQILALEGFKEKSADNILQALQASREIPFSRILFGMGIRYVGATVAEKLAEQFGSAEKLAAAGLEELAETPEIGERIAQSVVAYFSEPAGLHEFRRLETAGVQVQNPENAEPVGDKLAGKSFVVSGIFEQFGREEIKVFIKKNGGKVLSSVSAKTDFLLAGDKTGPSKIAKAEKHETTVISEQELIQMTE